ncbi:hypothetical protein [Celeribacter sp. PS-C1]|uniref:hypothetical protein n=1 Tax=Celeribacter sp. PS-C1 TaxID=2820813 RepID=UPI001CA4DD14|nr:hypothetical protein [Celeribacter sp. PS-C1]MBW6419509.1 hypothetical protein [Celeribacter sp. PS-C1]
MHYFYAMADDQMVLHVYQQKNDEKLTRELALARLRGGIYGTTTRPDQIRLYDKKYAHFETIELISE